MLCRASSIVWQPDDPATRGTSTQIAVYALTQDLIGDLHAVSHWAWRDASVQDHSYKRECGSDQG